MIMKNNQKNKNQFINIMKISTNNVSNIFNT